MAARVKRHHLVEMLEENHGGAGPQNLDSADSARASRAMDDAPTDGDRFRAALDTSGLGAWERDLATGRPLWARQVNDMFGIDFDDLDAGYDRLIERIHPEDIRGFDAECDPARKAGDRVSTEFRLVGPDDERWISSRGEVVAGRDGGLRLFAVLSDVTHEKVSDQALQTTLERSRASFAGAPFGTAYVSLDGRVRSANAALCSLTGYDEAGLRNRAISEFTLSDRWSEVVAGLIEAEAADGPSNAVFEGPLERSDGSRLVALFGVTLLRDQGGMPASLMLQVQDITKQREGGGGAVGKRGATPPGNGRRRGWRMGAKSRVRHDSSIEASRNAGWALPQRIRGRLSRRSGAGSSRGSGAASPGNRVPESSRRVPG